MSQPVSIKQETLVIPTWLPLPPDKNPMFLEKRVYQGSSGRIYPLPFTDRIAEKPVDHPWQAIWIENEFLRVLVLPEIGGRIHAIQDRTNGYDLIYRQDVIKPALVGLAGPWISGGIEFNWPQHHRPATFLPADFEIEAHPDGSQTIWCSDHDPMSRMKGMHGVCLHPGKSYVEVKVRAYNRTPYVQTFLWWANVATRVHEAYQSFFPPDVHYVADHARRAMSEYPLAQGFYYGVNYGERDAKGIPPAEIPSQFVPPHLSATASKKAAASQLPDYAPNDLSFYANIPVPTSYMCMGSQEDFFGGYDFAAQAGIIHLANHHISPGKKQWTWGNHDFGYAWDRNLTERDAKGEYGPYIEIMAGVYTDNQPDFSFLQPGETKTWSQYWYPIRDIGPARHANLRAAVALSFSHRDKKILPLGVAVTEPFDQAEINVFARGKNIFSKKQNLSPAKPFVTEIPWPHGIKETDLLVRVTDQISQELIACQAKQTDDKTVPPPATEPPAPAEIASTDELFITGLHLNQYRHATRWPVPYWQEALRRDPLDSRCNNALGLWHLHRGEFTLAEPCFRKAIERLTRRNPNPYDGEAYYNLGLCLRFLNRDTEAYAAFYKATWNQAWQSAGYHALAELDCKKSDWPRALEHLNHSLRFNTDNTRARNLKVMALRELNSPDEADSLLQSTRALDPLDWWARWLQTPILNCDAQARLDLVHDLSRAGFLKAAINLLEPATSQSQDSTDLPTQSLGTAPLSEYTLGWLLEKTGATKAALHHYQKAARLPTDYCFPARLEDIAVLTAAMQAQPRDPRAPYYLGNLLYDRRRQEEAIRLWERSAKLDPHFAVVWRNLGMGYFNILNNPAKASAAYQKAVRANPDDARLWHERDQLWKRLGESPAKRLLTLEKRPELVAQRDDLTVEFCALLNQTSRHHEAEQLLARRQFQPWEGGEGAALGQHTRTHLALGREALAKKEYAQAVEYFTNALRAPENLSEARHPLANQSDILYWLGVALDRAGNKKSAREHWLAAATFKGDFQEMSVRAFSEMTYYSALAWQSLGQKIRAKTLLQGLLAHARDLQKAPAKIDYFATSLPTMLLFDDDIQYRQETTALFLQAQAYLGLGQKTRAKKLLPAILKRDPNHALAADLLAELSR